MSSDNALGNQLVRDKMITEEQLRTALQFQQSLGGDLKTILMKLGYIKENAILHVVAEQQHVHDIDLDNETVDPELMAKLGREKVEQYQVLPLKRDTSYVVLAMGDPNDFKTIDTVQFLLGRKVEGVLASRAQIRSAIQAYYNPPDSGGVAGGLAADSLQKIAKLPAELAIKALVVTMIEAGTVDADAFLAAAMRLR